MQRLPSLYEDHTRARLSRLLCLSLYALLVYTACLDHLLTLRVHILQQQLKKPDAVNFSKPNPIHPFDDSTSLAFWSKKNDASLFAVGMHSKKRPNNLVLARTYDNEVMDMMELGVEMAKSVKEAKVSLISMLYAPVTY